MIFMEQKHSTLMASRVDEVILRKFAQLAADLYPMEHEKDRELVLCVAQATVRFVCRQMVACDRVHDVGRQVKDLAAMEEPA